MHPAYSIIFLSTASGAGYGLLFWLCLLGGVGHLPAQTELGWLAFIIAFVLAMFGLISSAFHLGQSRRGWWAFGHWRTSWLSREAVMAVLTLIPTGLAAISWVFGLGMSGFWAWMAVIGSIFSLLTILCTGQVYATIKAVPRWNHPAVVPVFIVSGVLVGTMLLNMLLAFFPNGAAPLQLKITLFMVLAGAYTKFSYWMSLNRAQEERIAAAAMGQASASPDNGAEDGLRELSEAQENYLQKEIGYEVARKHSEKLRWIAIIFLFGVPLIMLTGHMAFFGDAIGAFFAVLAVASSFIGLLVERWLFFAEAGQTESIS